MNEKRTHIKKTSFILKNFFNPIQKKIAIRKKTNSPTTHSTNNPIHSTKTFFTNQQEKTFLFLKKQDRKSHKKQRGKKTMIVFHQIIEKKIIKWIKKTTSNQIRHCTTFPPARTEATTCKKKTETTKQSHKRTHQKQFSSIKQNFFWYKITFFLQWIL